MKSTDVSNINDSLLCSFDTKDNIQLAEHVTIKDLKELMNHFSRGDNGSPSSDIRLDKGQFMGAITELLANSKWEYLLGSPDWEKQLDMLFNKVRDKGVIYLLKITPYHYLLQNHQPAPHY